MEEDQLYQLREHMVRSQIEARGIHDRRVLAAMRSVPRHCFLHESQRDHAYEDHPVGIGCKQTISQPFMVALMTQLLELRPEDRVLEIGTGSGYQSAVLSELVKEVVSVERHSDLALSARQRLHDLGFLNVQVQVGDGSLGWDAAAPFDAIMVTAGSPSVPKALKMQLGDRGRMICPTGDRKKQKLTRIIRCGNAFEEHQSVNCVFVPLIGEEGWWN